MNIVIPMWLLPALLAAAHAATAIRWAVKPQRYRARQSAFRAVGALYVALVFAGVFTGTVVYVLTAMAIGGLLAVFSLDVSIFTGVHERKLQQAMTVTSLSTAVYTGAALAFLWSEAEWAGLLMLATIFTAFIAIAILGVALVRFGPDELRRQRAETAGWKALATRTTDHGQTR